MHVGAVPAFPAVDSAFLEVAIGGPGDRAAAVDEPQELVDVRSSVASDDRGRIVGKEMRHIQRPYRAFALVDEVDVLEVVPSTGRWRPR